MPSKPSSTANSRSSSPPDPSHSPTEVTSLLPPSTASTATTHAPRTPHAHARKGSTSVRSISGRSYAGSVRNYGATPGPSEQAPRVSKKGQRRILTTWPIHLSFLGLTVATFASVVLTLILLLNTAMDLDGISPPYRGSGFTEFWVSAIGSWIGLGGVLFHSHPSRLYFLTSALTLFLHLPLLLLTLLSRPLKSAHHPLLIVPLSLTGLTIVLALLSNYLVRRARRKESERIVRMLTDAAARENRSGEESIARGLVGVQGGVGGRIISFLSGIVGLIAGLAGVGVLTLLLADLSISAYDRTIDLPSPSSRLVTIKTSPWPVTLHLSCSSSPSIKNSSLPTIIYEPSSGVPGSLALLDTPLPPSGTYMENPGRWLFEMQEQGDVSRVCVWDRPGYGFSDILSGADLGRVAEALWDVLEQSGETKDGSKFMLVGEGYGGLITRVAASLRPDRVHSLVHVNAQTARTYFSESPNGLGPISLTLHRLSTRLFPYLLTPLSLTRLPSLLLRRSTSISRILAASHPKPSTTYLNENILKSRLQETFGAHSHTSTSFRALLKSMDDYPRSAKAVVLSSKQQMEDDDEWKEGQRGLAEEVTGEEGLVEWKEVEGVGKWVCEGEGKAVCQAAVRRLLKG